MRVYFERVPDAKTLIRLSAVIGPDGVEAIHRRLVEIAREEGLIKGRQARVDTTVVETNIRYPTDSRLLADGVRSAFEEDRVILNAVQQSFATTHSPHIDIAIDSAPLRFRRRLRQLIDGERDARTEPRAT